MVKISKNLLYFCVTFGFLIFFINCSSQLLPHKAQFSRDSQPLRDHFLNEVNILGGYMSSSSNSEILKSTFSNINATTQKCTELSAYANGNRDVSKIFQNCLDRNVGNTLLIPPGIYRLDRRVMIRGPISIKSSVGNSMDHFYQCGINDSQCAHFISSNDSDYSTTSDPFSRRGAIHVSGTNVVMESMIIDGQRDLRIGLNAINECHKGNNSAGILITSEVDNFIVRGMTVKNAVCGSSFIWQESSTLGPVRKNGIFEGNIFYQNGQHDDLLGWSDGLTTADVQDLQVINNLFQDNTDIQIIFGGCRNCRITHNKFVHSGNIKYASFGEILIQNWPGGTSGNYTGTVVENNSIDCMYKCSMGIGLGANSWYPSSLSNSYGVQVINNNITRAPIALNVDVITGSTVLKDNIIDEVSTGTMSVCNGNPIQMAAINIANSSYNLLTTDSQNWVKNFTSRLPSSQLFTKNDYPNCMPEVSQIVFGQSYSLLSLNSKPSPEPEVASGIDAFLKHLYLSLFNRQPDAGGFQFWKDEYNNNRRGIRAITLEFLRSNENSLRARALTNNLTDQSHYLTLLYQVVLWREPDASGFQYWLDLYSQNLMTTVPLEDTFLNSDEFKKLCSSKGLRYE